MHYETVAKILADILNKIKQKDKIMGIKSTQTITRNVAIARMSYIITLLEEGLYDEAEASELNQMLEEVMDTDLFRFSKFENYKVVKSLEDSE